MLKKRHPGVFSASQQKYLTKKRGFSYIFVAHIGLSADEQAFHGLHVD